MQFGELSYVAVAKSGKFIILEKIRACREEIYFWLALEFV